MLTTQQKDIFKYIYVTAQLGNKTTLTSEFDLQEIELINDSTLL
jgi:hypothetical protein